MLDIEILRVIWWLLLGVLLIGFAVTDGFDFGSAILFPFVAKSEPEKRIVLNAIGPFWEGNQVWIILGAGAIFAAWPYVYAVSFSGFYLLVLLLLLTMGISRPVSFKYRSKLTNLFWRRFWDRMVFIGGIFPAAIFGILIGNILTGAPFHFDNSLRSFYTGNFLDLLTPFTLFCGLTSIMMLVMHGGFYLSIKTEDPIRHRAIFYAQCAAILLILSFAICGLWVAKLPGFEVISSQGTSSYSNPLYKTVIIKVGAWMENYSRYPISIICPILGMLGTIAAFVTARIGTGKLAFIFSALAIAGIISTIGACMFPFILPSSTDPGSSLLVWDASSSQLTLFMMLIAVVFFMPIILIYTFWVYHALSGKVSMTTVNKNKQSL